MPLSKARVTAPAGRRGSVCALLGPNGAGKTTAVRVLTTPARPSSGRAVVAGADVARQPAEVRRRIARVRPGRRMELAPGDRDALAAVGLLLLLRFALIWVGIYLGLALTPAAASAAWLPLLPLTMLANTFVSPALLPGPLGTIAEWNPLSATVASCRMLFGNPGWQGDSWAAEHALALAIGWPLLIALVFLPLSARRYRRLGG
ncbi:ATP-binding cassette domain-containing protein [Microbispora bryophytorum]|uniref:ATP-binding cassette domain-containing protein n=1 Tax=Microbispora bryophytorum TaxID=1460882 RepID=UPI0033E17B9C